eukprot:m.104087 g.104087  ORF g.104087 m.104087 type:complete len:465 (+) comp13832_c1_seq2:1416-2810(+)
MTDHSNYLKEGNNLYNGVLVKRSRHTTFGREQFKKRYFVLTEEKLVYFEGLDLKSCTQRDSIPVKSLRAIERANGEALGKKQMFQIIYDNPGKGNTTLYLIAPSVTEMVSWIESLRSACLLPQNISNKLTFYHKAPIIKGSFGCCGSSELKGCSKTTVIQSIEATAYDDTVYSSTEEKPEGKQEIVYSSTPSQGIIYSSTDATQDIVYSEAHKGGADGPSSVNYVDMQAYSKVAPKGKRSSDPGGKQYKQPEISANTAPYATVVPKAKRKSKDDKPPPSETYEQLLKEDLEDEPTDNEKPKPGAGNDDGLYANADAKSEKSSSPDHPYDRLDISVPPIPKKKSESKEDTNLRNWMAATVTRDQAVAALKDSKAGPGSYCIRPDSSGTKKVLTVMCADGEANHFRFANKHVDGESKIYCPDIPELEDQVFDNILSCLERLSKPDGARFLGGRLKTCIPCPDAFTK